MISQNILELAKESEHPRTYEVGGNLIKQVAAVTEKLGDLQEKMRKLKEVPHSAPVVTRSRKGVHTGERTWPESLNNWTPTNADPPALSTQFGE